MANGKKTDQQRIAAAERRQQALELRKAGASYRKIADTLAVSLSQAHDDVQQALIQLAELECASAGELRAMELARLDVAMLAIARQVQQGNLKAVGAWVRISESRRKLLGLDAPQKIAQTNPDGTPYETQQHMIGLVMHLLAPYPDLRLTLAAQLTEDADGVPRIASDGA